MTDADFSLLDLPQVRGMMFYPRRDRTPARAGAHDIFIAVEGARLHARRYVGEPDRPTVLLFHGNGEVVADYDDIAPVYAHFGLNLVVAAVILWNTRYERNAAAAATIA